MKSERDQFLSRARQAISNPTLQIALDNNAERRKVARQKGYASLPLELANMRQRAHEIRLKVVRNLEKNLDEFVHNIEANGFIVHRAVDGEEAVRITLEIARAHGTKTIAKAKSMITEEVHLNSALQSAGIRSVETDLGEFIVQLRGEPPAHIITPAVHLRREDVAKTFHEKLGMPYTTDVKMMVDVARRELRQVFLDAEIGVSGVNMAVAETGTLCVCTNEGNGRMVSTVPQTHIAIMGIERLVPSLEDLVVILQLLSRSATGQKLTNYVSLIQAPRGVEEEDGAEERHLILVDNGRMRVKDSPLQGSLLCIRCGACLNVCPVFRELGGHVYDSSYPGPIGSLVSPGLFGIEKYGHLAKASSLCSACADVCPVKVDFTTLLPRVRDAYISTVPQPLLWRLGMQAYAWIMEHPWAYHLAQKAAALGLHFFPKKSSWVRWMPPPASLWMRARHFPPFAIKTFRQRFNKHERFQPLWLKTLSKSLPVPAMEEVGAKISQSESTLERFEIEWNSLEGEFHFCDREELVQKISNRLKGLGVKTLMLWNEQYLENISQGLLANGFVVIDDYLPHEEPARHEALQAKARAHAGVTGVIAALADSGTLVLTSGAGMPLLASLLPPIHVAVMRKEDIFPNMETWLAQGGRDLFKISSNVVLISGPSRTADIEMTLTIGVHGPERVIVFCY